MFATFRRFACCTVIASLGCNDSASRETTSSPPPTKSEPLTPKPSFTFIVTDSAKAKLASVLAWKPAGTHITVSVEEVDNCTGYKYSLDVLENPSPKNYDLQTSNGIPVAVPKEKTSLLNGTTLDHLTVGTTATGFLFKNPNEKKPDSEKQPQ